ncbi:RNA-binding protein ARP1 [Spatholobus suberectus]|nr:RNA-binding protein ARP1 [Spatholobus suberectus]
MLDHSLSVCPVWYYYFNNNNMHSSICLIKLSMLASEAKPNQTKHNVQPSIYSTAASYLSQWSSGKRSVRRKRDRRTMSSNNKNVGQFGDTTLTKVFVGGLAWETQKETLREHFENFGEILEAVIISDKLTGRSKGYGFVTFKEAEAAKKACEDPSLIINGRRANCNLASLGARRPRSSSTTSPPQTQQVAGGGIRNANQVQWYYPLGTPAPASPFHHHPFPLYTPTYIATDINYNYNQKLSYGSGGGYMNGHVYTSQAIVGANTLMPMYPPVYHFHRTETTGVPAHIFHPFCHTASAPIHHS